MRANLPPPPHVQAGIERAWEERGRQVAGVWVSAHIVDVSVELVGMMFALRAHACRRGRTHAGASRVVSVAGGLADERLIAADERY